MTEFKVGKKYRKEEIERCYREFELMDFTQKANGKPVLKVIQQGHLLEFIKVGGKFQLL